MAYTIEGRELSDQLLLFLFSAEAKKLNSKLELECRKFLIKNEEDSVPDSWGGKPIKVKLENNSSLCYSEFVRQKSIPFTSV